MRLIDADKLDFSFDERCFSERDEGYCQGVYDAIGVVENAPTIDAVEVVRCKDCVHYKWICGVYCKRCEKDTVYPMPTNSDGFCCYGEKK